MVVDDGAVFAGDERLALAPLQRIGIGFLKSGIGHADALEADGQARGVHHGEHGGQPAVRWPDQFGLGAFEGHDAGGRGVDAQLVLDANACDGVTRAEAPVTIDQEFRA